MGEQAPAFSFYPKDFIFGIAALTLAQRGAYITLLSHQWDRGAIPDDVPGRARMLGCSVREAEAVWTVISSKFQKGDDGLWRNMRLERERIKQAQRREAMSENGKKGGRPKLTESKRLTRPKAKPKLPPANLNQSLAFPSSSSSSDQDRSGERSPLNSAAEPDADADLDTAHVTSAVISSMIRRFCELYKKYRFGAKYHVRIEKDGPLLRKLLYTYTPTELEKMTVVLLTTDEEFTSNTDRGIGILSVKASKLHSLISEYEAEHGAIAVAS